MAAGSIKSLFQFEGYKIDKFNFKSQEFVDLIKVAEIDQNLWMIDYGIRPPVFFKQRKEYVGGMDIRLRLYEKPREEVKEEDEPLVTLVAGIAGIFPVSKERFSSDVEENMVKHNIPAILMPYLRATVTSFLANAGWPSMILPLINMHELSKNAELEIEEK